MADYIPRSDADFNTWQKNFIDYVSTNLAALGLTAADIAPVTAAQGGWGTAYGAHVAAQAAAQGASQTKSGMRDDFEFVLRPLVKRIQSQPSVKDSDRAGMGINIAETAHRPVGEPDTRPVATVDTSQRLRHTINFSDETTPGKRAKPPGVLGCEIWVKIGDPTPTDPSELHFLATDTATPYVAQFEGADGGKLAHYWLRWVNRKGETGPWSQTVSAPITG